ncbi:protein O-mannosyl-transferase 2-like protein, partial [Dinothrombium tinctorium]
MGSMPDRSIYRIRCKCKICWLWDYLRDLPLPNQTFFKHFFIRVNQMLNNGDLVRLEHLVTTRNLHSHKELAPLTKKHFQVTCYGEQDVGDANDVWRVEIIGGAP